MKKLLLVLLLFVSSTFILASTVFTTDGTKLDLESSIAFSVDKLVVGGGTRDKNGYMRQGMLVSRAVVESYDIISTKPSKLEEGSFDVTVDNIKTHITEYKAQYGYSVPGPK